jgi:hypothetical protein
MGRAGEPPSSHHTAAAAASPASGGRRSPHPVLDPGLAGSGRVRGRGGEAARERHG